MQFCVPSTVTAVALRYFTVSGLSTVIVPLGLHAEIFIVTFYHHIQIFA